MLMSSANNTKYNNLKQSDIAFIYNKNSNGPNIKPCGTPHVINFLMEFIVCRLAYWVLVVEYMLNSLSVTPGMPKQISLSNNILRRMVQKALDKSMNIPMTASPSSNDSYTY